MSGVEGVEREDHDECEAGVRLNLQLTFDDQGFLDTHGSDVVCRRSGSGRAAT